MRQFVRPMMLATALVLPGGCSTDPGATRTEGGPGERMAPASATSGAMGAPPVVDQAAPQQAAAALRAKAWAQEAPVGAVRSMDMATSVAPDAPVGSSVPAAVADDALAMLIRTASAAVEVKELEEAVAAARRSAARHGGTVADAQVETGRNEVHRAMLQIRVPAARFDSLLAGLAPLGRVESVQVSAQDVGEEYVDIEARLANLRRLEARMVELLATRTGRLSDVLGVERELARVRGEIEQIEGRRRYLARSVAISTLHLSLHEPEPLVAGTPGSNPIASALRRAWQLFVGSVGWGIAALGVLVPAALLLGGAWLAGRRVITLARTRGAA